MVMTFSDTWRAIADVVRSGHRTLGVAASHIQRFAFEARPNLRPPYVLVCMLPGDWMPSIGSRPLRQAATVEIFCAVDGFASNVERMEQAVVLGQRVIDLIRAWEPKGLGWPTQPLVVDTVTATLAAVNVQFTIPYS